MLGGIITGLLLLMIALVFVAVVIVERRQRAAEALCRDHLAHADGMLWSSYSYGPRFQITTVNQGTTRGKPYVVAVLTSGIAIYPIPFRPDARLVIGTDQVRWFGRPRKYHYGVNELWLHTQRDFYWQVFKLRLDQGRMQDLVRALKEVLPPDQVTAYRRRRPYVHHGPVEARPAEQDMHGSWTLGDALSLYLMPAALVLLRDDRVDRVIALASVQKVSAIRRLDQPQADGLVRFECDGAPLVYALPRHDEFATALAEAARRTLEDPVQWQRKKKKGEVVEDDE